MSTKERARRIFAAWLDAADLGGPSVETVAFDLYPDLLDDELWPAIQQAEAMEKRTRGVMLEGASWPA